MFRGKNASINRTLAFALFVLILCGVILAISGCVAVPKYGTTTTRVEKSTDGKTTTTTTTTQRQAPPPVVYAPAPTYYYGPPVIYPYYGPAFGFSYRRGHLRFRGMWW